MIRLLLSVAALMAVLVAGYFILQETEEPSPQTSTRKVLSEASQSGEALFAENCASCHGVDLKGTDAGPPFLHKVYEPSHHSDDAFYYAVKRGVRAHHWSFGNMPPVEGLSDPEIAEIIAYIRKLQRAVGIN